MTEVKSRIQKIKEFLNWAIHFVTYDIWRITENEVSGLKVIYINAIKTIILAIRGFQSERIIHYWQLFRYWPFFWVLPKALDFRILSGQRYWIIFPDIK